MGSPVADEYRRLEELSPRESMRLLSSVSLGRIVFTALALPAIRPVNHLVDGDYVIIRTESSSPITSELRSEPGSVVAYEADMIDPVEHLGWSVIVVGVAHRVIDPDEAAPYRRALRPWVVGAKDQVIAIHTDIVTGFRLVADHAARVSTDGTAAAGRDLGLTRTPSPVTREEGPAPLASGRPEGAADGVELRAAMGTVSGGSAGTGAAPTAGA
jgi:hypothetical protein